MGDTPRSAKTKIAVNTVTSIVPHPSVFVRECHSSASWSVASIAGNRALQRVRRQACIRLSLSGTVSFFGCHGNLNISSLPDLRLFRLAGSRAGIILFTVPGMVVLGCSGVHAQSSFSSAILADLAIRGFAISFLTLARVSLPGLLSFLFSTEQS